MLVEAGVHQFPWRSDVTLAEFVESLFVKRSHPNIGRIKENLRAVKLKKLARLKFEPTDIRHHLKFDHKKAVVKIFHHAAFLKEQFRLTKDESPTLSISESIKLPVKTSIAFSLILKSHRGALPRPLTWKLSITLKPCCFPSRTPKVEYF